MVGVGNVVTGTVDAGAVDTGAVDVRTVDRGAVDTLTVVCGISVVVNSGGMPNVLPEEGPPFLVVARVFMVLLLPRLSCLSSSQRKHQLTLSGILTSRESLESKSNTNLRRKLNLY